MKRLLATIVAAGMIGASVMVSHAATLHVTAGTLQVIEAPADIGVPDNPDTTYAVTIEVRRQSGGSQNWQDPNVLLTENIPSGATYAVRLVAGTPLDCPDSVGVEPIEEPKNFGGSWGPYPTGGSPVVHTICARTGNLQIAVDVTEAP